MSGCFVLFDASPMWGLIMKHRCSFPLATVAFIPPALLQSSGHWKSWIGPVWEPAGGGSVYPQPGSLTQRDDSPKGLWPQPRLGPTTETPKGHLNSGIQDWNSIGNKMESSGDVQTDVFSPALIQPSLCTHCLHCSSTSSHNYNDKITAATSLQPGRGKVNFHLHSSFIQLTLQ